jgi:hypothetical protein
MGYFVAVKKHQSDAFQFARGHEWPSPEQFLDCGLPGKVAPQGVTGGFLRPGGTAPRSSANIQVTGPLTVKMGVTGLNRCHD